MSWSNDENYGLPPVGPGGKNFSSLSSLQQAAKNPLNQGFFSNLPQNTTNKIQGFLAPHNLRFAEPRNILKAEKNKRNAEQAERNAEMRQIQQEAQARLNAEEAVRKAEQAARNRNRLFREETTMPTAKELRLRQFMEQGYQKAKSRARRGQKGPGKYVERGNIRKKTRKTRR